MKTAELNSKCREYAAELVEAVRNEKNDRKLLDYFEFCSRFHCYSFQNRILIWAQKRDAALVAGFKAWQKMGRYVKKGEKGIAILAPMKIKKKNHDDPDRHGARSGGDEEILLRFRVVYVWDVSQTDGDPIPESPDIMSVQGNASGLLPALEAVVSSQGIELEYVDSLSIGTASGMSTGGAIKILELMNHEERFHVLAHELAHELLHDPQEKLSLPRKVKELEAEATAFVVSRHFGLNTKAPTYLALYRVEEVDIMASLERIVSTASKVIKAVEHVFREGRKIEGIKKAA